MASNSLLLPLLVSSLLLLLCLPLLLNLPLLILPACSRFTDHHLLCHSTQQDAFLPSSTSSPHYPDLDPLGPSPEDIGWLKAQLDRNQLGDGPRTPQDSHKLRKGINPRTRDEQLSDLLRYKGISHYEDGHNHTALQCPGELLVEEHHSNYGEPWAGGRDVFEFLAEAVSLKPKHRVLEVGCGTLRVGLHFIRFLLPSHYHCIEKDPVSLMAAFRYELPSHGLLHKRPVIARGEDMNFEALGYDVTYDLIYASAVFLHMPDSLVWTGLEQLSHRLASGHGRLYVSHNIKFCTRLPSGVCKERLAKLKMNYVGMHTHDSLLFNHYEIWHEFARTLDSVPS